MDQEQLFPFNTSKQIVLNPASDADKCLVAGKDRLEPAKCDGSAAQLVTLESLE